MKRRVIAGVTGTAGIGLLVGARSIPSTNPLSFLLIDLAFALIASAVMLLLARQLTADGSWMWRHGTRATDQFMVADSLQHVADAVGALANRQRRWKVDTVTAGNADSLVLTIRTRVTAATWVKRIRVAITQVEAGSLVDVTSSSPQLYDWGDNRRAVTVIRKYLSRSA